MRINQFVAKATGLSRRVADKVVDQQHVRINGELAMPGSQVGEYDTVTLDGKVIEASAQTITIMLNKPVGYVCSRDGQGSQTIYELLPAEYKNLKPVGRLDKDSSGLILLTNDGNLAQQLTHPKFEKMKVYEVELNKPLTPEATAQLNRGVQLEDGLSQLTVIPTGVEGSRPPSPQTNGISRQSLPAGRQARDDNSKNFLVRMHEGRNRQIRRTFVTLGYQIKTLHRIQFGEYKLGDLASGKLQKIS